MMASQFIEGLRVQKRVVWALMLRETKTLFGKHKLGYLWAIINAIFHISVFWVMRAKGGFLPPHGMSTPVFLLGGFIPFFIFRNGVTNGMGAIWANRSLLNYPQVFPLDPLIARVWLQSAMQTIVLLLLLCFAWSIGQHVAIANPHAIVLGMLLAVMFAFGGGSLCSGLNLMWPTTRQIVPMITRVLFLTSGLFYSVADLPQAAQKILFYNPLTHMIEFMRHGFEDTYGRHYVSLSYAFSFAVVLLVVGMLIERYSRRYLDRMV